jgi:creatinine amidohydrolase
VFVSFTQQTQATVWRGDAVAVIPLAAVETHGPHLPVGTDGLIAEGILDRAAELDRDSASYVRLPLVWLGASAEHAGRAGTLSCAPEHLIAHIVSIAEGLAQCGIRRVMLFNGHGGNIAAGAIAALKLRTQFNMLAARAHWLDFGLPKDIAPPAPPAADVHGGWIETSVLMHLTPKLVVHDAIAARPATTPAACLFPSGPLAWGWKLDDLAAHDDATHHHGGGWIGRPDLATAVLGRQLVDHAAQELLRALQGIAAAAWTSRK